MVARVSTLISLIMVALPELFASFSKIHDLLGTAGNQVALKDCTSVSQRRVFRMKCWSAIQLI